MNNMPGRPTKYKQDYDEQAEKLSLLGSTDKELADFFNVNVDTVHEWKKKYKSFSDALKRGKLIADMQVANKLFQKAIGGYKIKSQKAFVDKDGGEHVITVEDEAAPDTTAIIFWLKNRQPDKWREKQNLNIDFTRLSN